MEEFQTEQKSNFFMGIISLIAGALVTCVLYFGVSRLGVFSFWVSAIGITISLMGYNHFVKGSGNFGYILGAILNGIGIAIMLFVGFQNKKSNFSDKDNE